MVTQIDFAKKAAATKRAARTPHGRPPPAKPELIDDAQPARPPHGPAHGARAPRLLDKAEVCAIAGATYPTIWKWMREGKFPRSRVAGGKSMWLSTEIEAWMAALPVRALKGDETT